MGSSLRNRAQAAGNVARCSVHNACSRLAGAGAGAGRAGCQAGTVQLDVLSGICGGATMARYQWPRG